MTSGVRYRTRSELKGKFPRLIEDWNEEWEKLGLQSLRDMGL
jgi:hypothetical protein